MPPKSLAESLGVTDFAAQDEHSGVADGPLLKVTVKTFCKGVLNSPEYRNSLLRRIMLDELPPAVECMLWDRAEGKVVNHLEVKDTTNTLEAMTVEQLEDRALFLAEVARRLRSEPTDKVH